MKRELPLDPSLTVLHGADGDGKASVSSAIAARVRPLLFLYLVIPAKAGISVKHGNAAPHDRDSRLRGNDEKVAPSSFSIRAGMKEDANETPARPGRAAP